MREHHPVVATLRREGRLIEIIPAMGADGWEILERDGQTYTVPGLGPIPVHDRNAVLHAIRDHYGHEAITTNVGMAWLARRT